MKTYKTPKGKLIEPYYDGRNIRVKFTSGGELPVELSGVWTSEKELDNSMQTYLASKTKNDNI